MARVHSAAGGSGPAPPSRVLRAVFGVGPAPLPVDMEEASPSSAPLQGWSSHFQNVGSLTDSSFDSTFRLRLEHQVHLLRRLALASRDRFSYPVSVPELQAALRRCDPSTAPGLDGLSYAVFLVDDPVWHQALALFLSLVLCWARVPSVWLHGVVVPLFKSGDRRLFGNFRPITLLSCALKLLEHVLLARVGPLLDSAIDPVQAGFRRGADEHVYVLQEVLRLSGARATFCAFLDLRKAYDVAWRSSVLFRLHQAGVRGRTWLLFHALLSGTCAHARINGRASPTWFSPNGVPQGSVLSPILFNLLVDSVADAVRRVNPGVFLPGSSVAVSILLYADGVVILAPDADTLQMALDAATAWSRLWRFQFGIGPDKSAVVVFGRALAVPQFFLADQQLPLVSSYRYLGVIFSSGSSWQPHADHLIARGNRRLGALLGWAGMEICLVCMRPGLPPLMWSHPPPLVFVSSPAPPSSGSLRSTSAGAASSSAGPGGPLVPQFLENSDGLTRIDSGKALP